MRQQYHVIIIGGGFSGTALVIHLIRLGVAAPLQPFPLRGALTYRNGQC